MAKVITNKLHRELKHIISSLLDKAENGNKEKLAGMLGDLSNAETPAGYTD